MRTLVITTVATLGFAAAALAQSTAAPPALPKLLSAYSQPEITPGLCRNVNPGQTDCIIPAMSAGHYIIHAAGTSTSQGADAKQQLVIVAGTRVCGNATNTNAWPTGARTFKLDCDVTVITDKPLTLSVRYGDFHATKDPKGPLMSVERAGWEGVLDARVTVPKQ
jgi:hypothetical protein